MVTDDVEVVGRFVSSLPSPLKNDAVTAWVTLSDPVMTALPLKGNPVPCAFKAYEAVTALLAVPINSVAVTEPDVTVILPVGTISPFLAINSFAIIPLLHISKGE
jgi:hypothetical protein